MGQRKRKSTRPAPKKTGDAVSYTPGLHRTLCQAIAFWERLGTPVALKLTMLARAGDFDQLVRASVDPRQYLHAVDFRKDYAAVRYLAKVKGLIPEEVLEEVALRSFKAAEDRCTSTNIRLTNGQPLKGAEHLIHQIRGKIASVLGRVNLDEIVGLCRWGPGATATISGAMVRPEEKLLEPRLSVTRKLWRFAREIVGRDLHWCRARLGVDVEGPCTLLPCEFAWVEYMRVVTVDKDSKTKRTIGAEPTLNTYVQQGIGRAIRKRLCSIGINLNDQKVNQTWAQLARDLGLATVDLSSASDLISYWLVELLLPRAWFELLDAARSSHAKLPSGKVVELSKFSSMGNGFTFELETLIFWAIAQAVTEEVGAWSGCVSVYGDDIIVPDAAYGRLEEIFQLFGFKVNSEKSYSSGEFFESCGEHYFGGENVTPVYQKELLDDVPQLIRAYNRLHRWSARAAGQVPVDDVVTVSWGFLRQAMQVRAYGPHKGKWPSCVVPQVPYGTEGDEGCWVPVSDLDAYFCPDRGFLCSTVKLVPNKVETVSYEALLAVTFSRTMSPREPEDKIFLGPSPGTWLDERWRHWRTQAVPDVSEDLSFQGKVTLRGYTGYRITKRWFAVHR